MFGSIKSSRVGTSRLPPQEDFKKVDPESRPKGNNHNYGLVKIMEKDSTPRAQSMRPRDTERSLVPSTFHFPCGAHGHADPKWWP